MPKPLFAIPDPEFIRRRLAQPAGVVEAILDTDTFNEIDDQFALAYALRSPELNMRAITAAPFFNSRSQGPADGMEKSYQEIAEELAILGKAPAGFAFRGSTGYLPDERTPVDSEAARRIIELAREERPNDAPLYVLAIGAITNVASALLLAPEINRRIVVVWLGGHALYAPHNREFNLYQDVPAARVIFDSGVPLVHIPCIGVAELLITCLPELERLLEGCGEIGKFLYGRTRDYLDNDPAKLKVIWDISTVAWFTTPQSFSTGLIPSPHPGEDAAWSRPEGRHEIREVFWMERNAVFQDMCRRLCR